MRYSLLIALLLTSCICSAQRKSLPAIDTLLQKADYQKVFFLLDSLEKAGTTAAAINYYRVLCYDDMKEYNEGARLCSKLIDEHPAHDSILVNLYVLQVDILLENQNYEAAIKASLKLINLDPHNANHYVNLSVLYGMTSDLSKSLKALRDGLKYDRKNLFIYNNLAYYSGHYKHYAQAIKYANIGLQLPQDSDSKGIFYNNRGYAEMKLHRLKKANRDIDLAMIWNSKNCYAYYYKALAILNTKNNFEICKYVDLAEAHGGRNMVAGLRAKYCH